MKKNINKKIILFDIETSYTVSATWGLFETNVAKVIREPYIISCAYKFLGEKTVHVISLPDFSLYKKDRYNDRDLVKELHKIFDKAEIVVAHNLNSFDYKWVYGRFAIHGMTPPSPCKQIDTLLISRAKFRFNSNRLNDLSKYFGLGEKVDTGGIDLWYNCIEKNDKKSWDLMCKYNKQDVILLEKVYLKLLPFITNHPNLGLIEGNEHACPNCGSTHVQRRGFEFTRASKSQRWQCQDCASWHKSPIEEEGEEVSQIR